MSVHDRPPQGQNVDETHVVKLLPEPPSPCVSVRLGDGRVFLSRRRLEEMAGDAALIGKIWKMDSSRVTEAQRLGMINGRRAGDLLTAILEHADASGYLSDDTKLPGEAGYLLSQLLEEGAAAVVSLARGHAIPVINVHYKGVRAGPTAGIGHRTFSFDIDGDRGLLLMIDWWVS